MDATPLPAQHPVVASGRAESTPVETPAESTPAQTTSADTGPTGTGHVAVDAAVSRLPALDQLPLEQHAEVFDEIHRALAAALEAPLEAQQART